MAKQLHPHLKHFIRSVVAAELHEAVGPSKRYEWKEGVMREMMEAVLAGLEDGTTQEQLAALVASAKADVVKKIMAVVDMAGNVITQVPVDVLRSRR